MSTATGHQLSVIFNSSTHLTAGFICILCTSAGWCVDYSFILYRSKKHTELHNKVVNTVNKQQLASEIFPDFQNKQCINYSFRQCRRSTDSSTNISPQSTSRWLLCMCLVLVAAAITSKGDSLSFIVFLRVLLLHYQYPVDRKSCLSYFTYEKTKMAPPGEELTV